VTAARLDLPDDQHVRDVFADEELIREAYWRPRAGETALDVGSYLGSYTIPALIAGADVIAVEPHSGFSDRMTAIMQANKISASRLTLIEEVLAAPGGYSQEFWQGLAWAPCQDIYATRGMTFTTLDELTSRLGTARLDWVKIDVEGAELGVLQGGQETLKRFRPHLLIEDHGSCIPFVAAMGIPGQCLELLRGLGYSPKTVRHTGAIASPDRDFWVCSR
jgi:FkbM family methyltransferase